MLSLLYFALQILFVVQSVRQEEKAGVWSWSKFVFALGFAALEVVILIGPLYFLGLQSPIFWPVFSVAAVVAALNFIWMIIVARRWKLPDGRTSLQAYRDEQEGK